MRAWTVQRPGALATGPLVLGERPRPEPGSGQLLVEVSVCGVCRTDLHVTEGDLPVHRAGVVPGHEVVGRVVARGPGATEVPVGARVGVAWLGWTCGACRWCRRGQENLCPRARFTGWDLDGGYADFVVADERYVYALPAGLGDEEAAPLLCAGIIGYRALRLAQVPPGGRVGLYGFGASAHLAAQLVVAQGGELYVMTRSAAARRLAESLGAVWTGPADAAPPVPLDAAVLFAPVGTLVPTALAALDRGGVLSIAGIHLSDVPALVYEDHLFYERTVRSVTANTRRDGEEFLALAERLGVRATTTAYPLTDADRALADLAGDRLVGAAVLRVSP